MNFKDSSSISIPLVDPILKNGNGYKVAGVFLANAIEGVEYKNLPDSSNDRAFFEQRFDSPSLDLRWHVQEPINGEVYKEASKIKQDKYISGFDVTIYKNNRDLIGESVAVDRAFIRKYTGIETNQFNYPIEDLSIRSYSVDIDLYDHFGNTHTATFITKNPEASAEILSYEEVGGVLNIEYSGSEDLEYLKVSNYSGDAEYQMHECYTGQNGTVSIPLIPNMPNYLKIEPYDGFGYSKPIDMSGYSLEYKKSYDFNLDIKSVKLNKKEGGRAVEFDMRANFENNPYVSAKYEVLTSGSITGAELGYDDFIYLDYGEFNNTLLNSNNTGFNYTIDNEFTWQNSINTGILTSGDNDPSYAYWDSSDMSVKSLSLYDIRSGEMPVRGIFTMPANEPNSYNIKFRSGINFNGEYEKAASFLNTIGEMPAVIINESQANIIKSYENVVGWIGLRRNKVAVLDGLFSENQVNQNLLNSLDYNNQESKVFSTKNKAGETEEINYISNDIGVNWAWVNSSGTHIYKYVESNQYNPEKYFKFKINAESTISDDSFEMERNLFVLPIDMSRIETTVSGEVLSIDYQMKEGDSVERVDLHTGDNRDFIPSEDNLVQQYEYDEDSSFDYTVDKNNPPEYFKANFFDFIGTTDSIDINQMYYETLGENNVTGIYFSTTSQATTLLLDEAYDNSERFVDVKFNLNHNNSPDIEYSIQYTGTTAEPEFLNSMVLGLPTVSGVSFLLDKVPPEPDYLIRVLSNDR